MDDPSSRTGRVRSLLRLLIPLVFLLQPALSLPDLDLAWPAAVGLALLVVLYVGTLASLSGPGDPGSIRAYRLRLTGLGLLATLGVALSIAYGSHSGWMLVMAYVAATGACVVASRRGAIGWLAGTTAVTAGIAALLGVRSGEGALFPDLFWTTLVVALVGMLVFFGRTTYEVIAHLHRTRAELAETAVEAERLRFSRDLHDLLGHTLSLIVVKAEVAKRLADQDPTAAAREAGQIEQIGRRALAELREAVAGYRQRAFAAELAAARTALSEAGIQVTVTATELPPAVDGLFGWVVREAATNVIRHSRAGRCHIAVSRSNRLATLEVQDDGPADTGPDGPGPAWPDRADAGTDWPSRAGTGRGLTGLRERLVIAGGELAAGPAEPGWRLLATVPMTDDRSGPPAGEASK